MSEAIISRRGYTAEGKPQLMTETITDSREWTVPNVRGNISVLIFGGGSAGSRSTYHGWGGGSGWMNNGEFALANGTSISITIGKGGNNRVGGGTTAFGIYLSANGASGFSGGSGGGSAGGGSGGGGGGSW